MRWENSQDTDFQGRRTACKAVYAGSIPTLASNKTTCVERFAHGHFNKKPLIVR